MGERERKRSAGKSSVCSTNMASQMGVNRTREIRVQRGERFHMSNLGWGMRLHVGSGESRSAPGQAGVSVDLVTSNFH